MRITDKFCYLKYMVHSCGVAWLPKYILLQIGQIPLPYYDRFVKENWSRIASYDRGKLAKELQMFYKACAKQDDEKGDILHPVTFNEKIQYLKIFDDISLRTRLSDKYLVREWIKEKIGEEYLVPLYGVWDAPEKIDFSTLPESFILKTNCGSGNNIVVHDKSEMDEEGMLRQLEEWMGETYGVLSFENQYWNIEKKIIAEELLQEEGKLSPVDYKFYCFNGVPEYIHLITDRNQVDQSYCSAFYNTNWEMQNFDYAHKTDISEPEPSNLQEMLTIAALLSEGFPFVRVDLYSVVRGGAERIYFGEMTFTPAAGCQKWTPASANRMLGDKIRL